MATITSITKVDDVAAKAHANRTLLLELNEALERRGMSGLSAELAVKLECTGGQPKQCLGALNELREEVEIIDDLLKPDPA